MTVVFKSQQRQLTNFGQSRLFCENKVNGNGQRVVTTVVVKLQQRQLTYSSQSRPFCKDKLYGNG